MSELDKLVSRMLRGEDVNSDEDLQLYKNNSEEVERRLKEAWEDYERRVATL